MDRQQLLSICIPTYNRSVLLRRHVEHLSKFRDLAIEIVVSDNHSTDDTSEVMRELAMFIPNLVYHRQPKPMSVAFNWRTAITKATSKYAFAIADDDLCIEDQLLDAVRGLELDSSLLCVYGGYYEVDLAGNIINVNRKTDRDLYFSDSDRLSLLNQFFSLEIPVFRRDFFVRSTIFRENSWLLSWDFVRACLDVGRIRVSPLLFAHHTIHPHRITETRAADGEFNFGWISEFETFLAGVKCDANTRLSALLSQIAKVYQFHASVCMRNRRALDARMFIKKGLCYVPEQFAALAINWEDQMLVRGVVESLVASLQDRMPARGVWIEDPLPEAIFQEIRASVDVLDRRPRLEDHATIVIKSGQPNIHSASWDYFDVEATLRALMMSGRRLVF